MKPVTYLRVTLAWSTLALAPLAVAQSAPQASSQPVDQSSLGDYAKKVRKEPAAKARPKVFDNDNLPTDDKLSVVGQKPVDNGASADDRDKDKDRDNDKGKSGKPTEDPEAKKQAEWKNWQVKLTGQKDQIDLASRELDVLQREYQLRAAAIYADAGNRLRNELPWDKEDAQYKQKIADKQKSVDDAKQKLSDMQEEARKAGVPSSMIE